jgi:V/A-type H+-transporting ATPase subunit E
MEVLKTSETLEKQILEDARKKASRVLEGAEREIASIRAEWEAKADKEKQRLEAECDAKIAALRREIASSLPLDFMRTRLASIERTLSGALAEVFNGMPDEELARVIGLLLGRAASAFRGARLVVTCEGLPSELAGRIVRESIRDAVVEKVTAEPSSQPGGANPSGLPRKGIIVATTDGRVRFRGTVKEIAAILMEERREELVTALLGKDA